jgi:hypothetical protein
MHQISISSSGNMDDVHLTYFYASRANDLFSQWVTEKSSDQIFTTTKVEPSSRILGP